MSGDDPIVLGLEQLRREHLSVPDCWYSCPKSGDCCNEAEGDECNCGADAHNALIDALLALVAERGQ